MKKDYMKPEGNVVALLVNENISTSISSKPYESPYGIEYDIVGDSRYITGDPNYPATDTGNPEVDQFLDWVLSFMHNLPANCRYKP